MSEDTSSCHSGRGRRGQSTGHPATQSAGPEGECAQARKPDTEHTTKTALPRSRPDFKTQVVRHWGTTPSRSSCCLWVLPGTTSP